MLNLHSLKNNLVELNRRSNPNLIVLVLAFIIIGIIIFLERFGN